MTESLTHRVAGEIRAEMARQRVQQRQVAAWLGISQPQAGKRLRGELAFDTGELEVLAERLGVSVRTFFPERSAA